MEEPPRWEPPVELLTGELFQTDQKTLEEFKSGVEKSKGLAMIFVHPYFVTENEEWNRHENNESLAAARTMRRTDAFIGSESKNKPPIIIFEESHRIQETAEHIRSLTGTSVLIMPTISGTSIPALPGSNHVVSSQERAKAWPPIIRSLKYLGVKKILLGGMYLGMTTTWTHEKQIHLTECVGGVYGALSYDFEVEISSFTFPTTRKDVYADNEKEA